jgi:hypothetical protein
MAIDITGANTYFLQHFKNDVWLSFPLAARTAAVASARRLLSKALGRPINDVNDWAAYTEGDVANEGAAVYEQSLYFLQTGRIADGASPSAPYPTAMPQAGAPASKPVTPEASPRPIYSDEALRWLAPIHTCSLVRG